MGDRPDFNLPVRRAAQMDRALAAGLSLEQLDVLVQARRMRHEGRPVAVGLDDRTGDDEAAGAELLRQALANPAALLWDEVFVTAMRRRTH